MTKKRKTEINGSQREEITLLLRAGVSRKDLAREYRVRVSLIERVSEEYDFEGIKPSLLFAQRAYSRTSNPRIKDCIEKYVLSPIALKIAERINPRYAEDKLLEAIFGKDLQYTPEFSKSESENARELYRTCLDFIKLRTTAGLFYRHIGEAEDNLRKLSQIKK